MTSLDPVADAPGKDLRPAPVARPLGGLLATGRLRSADPDAATTAVTGITLDSRAVRPGDLYAALPGARAHGADFAAAAVAAGAAAVLTDVAGAAKVHGVPVLVADDPRAELGEVPFLHRELAASGGRSWPDALPRLGPAARPAARRLRLPNGCIQGDLGRSPTRATCSSW